MSKKILILDDELEYLAALKDFLMQFDFLVEPAVYPNYALDLISKHKPEVVLFDYKLPDMDGDTFFKKAKEISDKTKYILITAYRDDAVIEKFKKMGVDDAIIKPINLEELLGKIQKILRESD